VRYRELLEPDAETLELVPVSTLVNARSCGTAGTARDANIKFSLQVSKLET